MQNYLVTRNRHLQEHIKSLRISIGLEQRGSQMLSHDSSIFACFLQWFGNASEMRCPSRTPDVDLDYLFKAEKITFRGKSNDVVDGLLWNYEFSHVLTMV